MRQCSALEGTMYDYSFHIIVFCCCPCRFIVFVESAGNKRRRSGGMSSCKFPAVCLRKFVSSVRSVPVLMRSVLVLVKCSY